jgi:hypothetical protein
MTKDSLSVEDVVAAARPGLDKKKNDILMESAPQMNACCEKVKTIYHIKLFHRVQTCYFSSVNFGL